MIKKNLLIVLHSHIPYVYKSGMWPFGEEWLYEVMADTYIPFISLLEKFDSLNYKTVFTVNLSPVLLEQIYNDEIQTYRWHMTETD